MAEKLTFALAGNPNSGKTTIFNNLVGAREHVGNWPGVTVEKKSGTIKNNGREIEIVDLPGTYSLTAFSMEEIIARDFIVEQKPDVVINIVDASNLERNLYLTVQLRELGAKIVVALNMHDLAGQRGIRIDAARLEQLLGVAVVPTVGNKNKGMEPLLQAALAVADGRKALPEAPIRYGKELEDHLTDLIVIAEGDAELAQACGAKWLALKALEKDKAVVEKLERSSVWPKLSAELRKVEKHLEDIYDDTADTIIADARYGFIAGAVKEAVKRPSENRLTVSDKIDKVVTNRFLGLPIFLLAMWLTFKLTFTVGEIPMGWLETFFAWLGGLFDPMADGLLKSLLVDGVIGGVGGVLGFFPLIIMLFLAIAFLEDSGYMARAAFVMDRVMNKVGLHGKSFIPMIVGFGCTVPAIYATRTLENRKDRMITMLVAPLMSCGARLPVYVLLIGAFFATKSENYQANLLTGIYVLGIVLAIVMAMVFRKTLLPGQGAPFVMELPPYRLPTFKGVLIHTWERGWLYLKKAGTVILAVSIIFWAAMTFPGADNEQYETLLEQVETTYAAQVEIDKTEALQAEYEEAKGALENTMASRDLEASIAGSVGKGMEPFIRPLGFDWRIGISLLAGFAAKEVVVGTMGTIYSLGGEEDEESAPLREKIGKDPAYSPAMALALMVFTLIYLPCMVAMAAWHKEAGSRWKWTLFLIAYTTALAWVMSFAAYHLAPAFGIEKTNPIAITQEAEQPWASFLQHPAPADQAAPAEVATPESYEPQLDVPTAVPAAEPKIEAPIGKEP
ncbi:MAG TPA: ferrous iron transport protein B [bacterium]|nr:ferrous iron transport protein B [bacterium]